jgi:drug/metabolite transporter (DMT)-like permease
MIYLILITAFLWGFSDYFSKRASGHLGYGVYLLLGNVSALLFLPAMLSNFNTGQLPFMLLGCAIYLVGSYSIYLSLRSERASIVFPVVASGAIVAAIALGVVFGGESFPEGMALGALLAIIGLFLVLLEKPSELAFIKKDALLPMGVTIVAWGVSQYWTKLASATYSGAQIAFVVGLMFSIIALFLIWKNKEKLDLRNPGVPFVTAGGIGYNLALIPFAASLVLYPVSLVAALTSFYPAITMCIAVFFGKEKIAKHQIAGALILLGAVAYLYIGA